MIRLAVVGLAEAALREVAARLRGVACVPVGSVEDARRAAGCDGVVIVGPTSASNCGTPASGHEALGKLFEAASLASPVRAVLVDADCCGSDASLSLWRNAARASGARCVVRNFDRWLPSRQLIRQQLDAGKLGAPGLVRSHRWEPARANAAGDKANGASEGPLPVGLLRDLDVAVWLSGAEPELLFATGTDESLQVHLGFPGGPMALVGYGTIPEGDAYTTLSVIAASGAAYADDHQNRQLLFRGGRALGISANEGIRPLASLFQQFAESLAKPARGESEATERPQDQDHDLAGWRRTLRLGKAIRESLESRQAVSTPSAPHHP